MTREGLTGEGGGKRGSQADTGRSGGALAWGRGRVRMLGLSGVMQAGPFCGPSAPVLRAPPLSTIFYCWEGASTAQLRNYSVEGGLGVGDGRFALGWAGVSSPADPLDMCL